MCIATQVLLYAQPRWITSPSKIKMSPTQMVSAHAGTLGFGLTAHPKVRNLVSPSGVVTLKSNCSRGVSGVVWCGLMWCGVVWCGVVWCGVV